MGEPDDRRRIQRITLDERTVIRRSAVIEHERAVAIYDLLERNHFSPACEAAGPYALHLSIEDNRLVLDIGGGDGEPALKVPLPLLPFRRTIRDYFQVCESYYEAIRNAPPSRIEAIDMGRRALHDEGSEKLREALAGKVEVDIATARRLFTLICVLHLRAPGGGG